MKILDLSFNKIDQPNLTTIINSLQEQYCEIQVLKLSGITPAGVVSQLLPTFTNVLAKNTSLLSLSLSGNNIDHVAARDFLPILQETVPLPPKPESQTEGQSTVSTESTTQTHTNTTTNAPSSSSSYSQPQTGLLPSLLSVLPPPSTITSQIANLDLRNNKIRVCILSPSVPIQYT